MARLSCMLQALGGQLGEGGAPRRRDVEHAGMFEQGGAAGEVQLGFARMPEQLDHALRRAVGIEVFVGEVAGGCARQGPASVGPARLAGGTHQGLPRTACGGCRWRQWRHGSGAMLRGVLDHQLASRHEPGPPGKRVAGQVHHATGTQGAADAARQGVAILRRHPEPHTVQGDDDEAPGIGMAAQPLLQLGVVVVMDVHRPPLAAAMALAAAAWVGGKPTPTSLPAVAAAWMFSDTPWPQPNSRSRRSRGIGRRCRSRQKARCGGAISRS